MGLPTACAPHALDGQFKAPFREPDCALIPSVINKAPFFMAGTFDGGKVEFLKEGIVRNIRKGLVRWKNNRYHNPVLCRDVMHPAR